MIVNGYKIEPGVNHSYASLEFEDLTGADLSGADLHGANLHDTNLFKAKLILADLTGADLRDANLGGARLSGAKLRNADLTGADLTGADLTGADLTYANLSGARITEAQIASADGSLVGKKERPAMKIIQSFLNEIDLKLDVEVIETPENQDSILARLEQLSSDVARLAGISKAETPAKTVLAAIEASNLTLEIMELVSDAVLDCADME